MLKPVRGAPLRDLPVTLAEVKAWCGVDFDDDDALLSAILSSSVDYFDGYSGILGRAIMPQMWTQYFDGFSPRMRLPLGPAQNILFVQYYDVDNLQQQVPRTLYGGRVHEDSLGPYVEMLQGQSWPSAYNRVDAVQVMWRAGFADADSVPGPIKTAIKMHAATLYEFRESETNAATGKMHIYEGLIAPFRRSGV